MNRFDYWSHGEIPFEVLEPHISFPFLDLRQQVHMVSNDGNSLALQRYGEYLRDGEAAERLQQSASSKAPKHVNGVKRRWLYHQLPYANVFLHCAFDPMHCLGNIAELVLAIITGEKYGSPQDLQLAAVQGMHPEWARESGGSAHMPWQLLANAMEQRMACLNIPRGQSNNYSVPKMTSERGNLSTHQRIVILTTYFKSLSHQLLHAPYRLLFSQLSDDVVAILSPSLEVEDLPHLFEKVSETVALMEGTLPESGLTFIVHEILDIVAALQRFGPIRSWWMFHCERVNRTIRALCPPAGGRSMAPLLRLAGNGLTATRWQSIRQGRTDC